MTHTFGARNDNGAFHDYFERFYTNVLFPYLENNNITKVIQFGDLFDRRKYINFVTLQRSREYFFDVLESKGIDLDVFVGNHDTFYKNTNDINSPELLLSQYPNISVYTEPTDQMYGDLSIALLPWVNSGNYNNCVNFIKNTSSQILFGHLELAGFEMYRGVVNDHGMDASLFQKFDIVGSGHFHHRSTRGNIHYLGTPYELTWSDYNDPRGFHIFDTTTREIEFVENCYRMFNKLHYNDMDKSMDDVVDIDFDIYKDTYVKVIVHNKTNPYWFDIFINRLEKAGVVDLQVVEDHLNLNLEDDSDIVEEAEDTLTILKKVVEGMDVKHVPKKALDSFLTSLYTEAMHAE